MTEREADRKKHLENFQSKIGYEFSNSTWLEQALTHSSYAHEHGLSVWNERLEFLGDAVLELIVSEHLFKEHPVASEGKLTQERSSLVREEVLTSWGRSIGLDVLLQVGKGTRGNISENMIGDAVEALIGAIYLDGGMDAASAFVSRCPLSGVKKSIDAKSLLQIKLQKDGLQAPRYELVAREGSEHDPIFTVRAWYGVGLFAEGSGSSRKVAEQDAAKKALETMNRP